MPNPYEKRSNPEGMQKLRPLKKIGLETPLVGKFWGENKRLVFTPPHWYQLLVLACFTAGMLFGLTVFFSWSWMPLREVGVWLCPSLLLAGTWALLSMEYAVFDLRSRTYFRREGGGLLKRSRRGSLVDLDAVVLNCEHFSLGVRGVVIYRIVLHWKNSVVPLLVTERQQSAVPTGASLNFSAGSIAHRAQRYAGALGVPFYDNSHFHSPAPQAPV